VRTCRRRRRTAAAAAAAAALPPLPPPPPPSSSSPPPPSPPPQLFSLTPPSLFRRAYFTQRLLWELGLRVGFAAPWVVQYRNAHNYLADFNSEIPLFQQAMTPR